MNVQNVAAFATLRNREPQAMNIHTETAACPKCKKTGGMVSYLLPGDPLVANRNGDTVQTCHFYCIICRLQWNSWRAAEVEAQP